MSTAISFISGKGGSGKTTLVLSIADLLCRCEINTLIVDCDFSTNGATFFYESLLRERQINNEPFAYSLSDIIFNSTSNSIEEKRIKPITIKQNLFFIPSIAYISNELHANTYYFSKEDIYGKRLFKFIQWAKSHFDVILFDCQAGFTDILYEILPFMDADLFILEPDSISASSMRNLHLKIGNQIGTAKLYQVFNKASQEEFDIYSKIDGTFFTNIGTLLFDWKIRKAFSISQTPDLETISKDFGYALCDICKTIITDEKLNSAINDYSSHLGLLQRIEERKSIEEKLFDLSDKRKASAFSIAFVPLLAIIISQLIIILYINWSHGITISFLLTVLAAFLGIYISLAYTLFFSRNSKDDRELRRLYEKKLGYIDYEIDKLKKADPYYDNTESN